MTTAHCPICGIRTAVNSWTREPCETTYEQVNPTYRTFEPGPFADVVLACGCELHGVDGVRFLQSLSGGDRG